MLGPLAFNGGPTRTHALRAGSPAIDAVTAQHGRVGAQMVEQAAQTILDQRQPMVHARHAAPLADRLIQLVGGCAGAKGIAVTGAESLDAGIVEQGFAGGQQGKAVNRAQ